MLITRCTLNSGSYRTEVLNRMCPFEHKSRAEWNFDPFLETHWSFMQNLIQVLSPVLTLLHIQLCQKICPKAQCKYCSDRWLIPTTEILFFLVLIPLDWSCPFPWCLPASGASIDLSRTSWNFSKSSCSFSEKPEYQVQFHILQIGKTFTSHCWEKNRFVSLSRI